jgi:hypothetical protein
MGKIDKIYIRSIRDNLGRYPTWPILYPMELGLIGFYHGKSATFEWVDKLENMGIHVEPSLPQKLMDDVYCSGNSVHYGFKIDEKTLKSKASFRFTKTNSIAAQAFDLEYRVLPMDSLLKSIKQKLADGLKWNDKWVIVTELWLTKGFTALISGSNKSSTEMMTSAGLQQASFNIANPDLGIEIVKAKCMGYQGVAKTGINPYFQVHRLINDERVGYYLKKYGKKMIFFPDKIR